MRQPSNGRRYERATAFLEQDVSTPNTSDTTTNIAIELASVFNSVDVSIPEGRARMTSLRGVEVGGLVLDWGVEYAQPLLPIDVFDNQQMMLCSELIVSDRVGLSGAPVAAANYDYYEPSVPFLDPQGSSSGQTEDFDMPTQIHYRHTHRIDWSTVTMTNPTENTLNAVNGQRIHGERTGHINKKMRLLLDDQHGIYFVVSFHSGAFWAVGQAISWKFWLHGSIYWRTVSPSSR